MTDKTTITFSRTQSPGHPPFTQDAGLRLLAAAVPSLLCCPPSNYFSIARRVSSSQLASRCAVDVSPACIQFRLAFSSNCTGGEDLVSGQPVAQLAVRSRVAPDPDPQPFSEWCLLHYYSHDSNGERLTQYIYAHACMGLSASFTFSLH